MKRALHFVYNANSGKLNALKDSLHKWLSPETYNCDLCSLTHHSFQEVAAWKTFRQEATLPMYFYHKDEFEKAFRSKWLPKYEFPIILMETEQSLEVFMTAEQLKAQADAHALIASVTEKLQAYN
ncbi:GTPase [Gilvibacter sp.]|jgi:hypothetical protein|uniref:GTPase n=1 Tax=Gilvibacter sp. TaxID=2729997 RepID=UPI003B52F754